jgi:hypothetical protein
LLFAENLGPLSSNIAFKPLAKASEILLPCISHIVPIPRRDLDVRAFKIRSYTSIA